MSVVASECCLRIKGCAPRHPCRTRGCAPRHPCRTSRCEGGALPALEGALRRPSPHPRVRSDVRFCTPRVPRCPFRTPGRARAPFSAPKGALKGCFPHPGCFVPIEKKKNSLLRTPGRGQASFSAPKGALKGCFPQPGGFVPIEKKKKKY